MKEKFDRFRELLERIGDKEQKRKDHCQIIDEFYDDNITQIENSGKPIFGKQLLLEMENQNLDGVKSVTTKISELVFDIKAEKVWGIMVINFDSKKNGKKRLEEAFIQKWSNNKIVYQRFFYRGMIDEE